ncbi:hypothetical protein BPTFM16_02954 [Altererythrobacter insulae]|nr:hypothetical protein BPTFM16_02954 [Altererythrobacter insulae]
MYLINVVILFRFVLLADFYQHNEYLRIKI